MRIIILDHYRLKITRKQITPPLSRKGRGHHQLYPVKAMNTNSHHASLSVIIVIINPHI